jgi:hypothetical protein
MYTTISSRRRMGAALAFLLLALAAPAPAGAADPAEPVKPAVTDPYCPLERIGSQLVRCDNLTGLGVPAPYWIPEQ